jgi:hypothetical protein
MCGRAAAIILVSGLQNKEIDEKVIGISTLEESIVSIVGVDDLKDEAPVFS